MDMGYLVGDCLLAAAFLSYMGPFLSSYRDEMVTSIWMKQVSWFPLASLLLFVHAGFRQTPLTVAPPPPPGHR